MAFLVTWVCSVIKLVVNKNSFYEKKTGPATLNFFFVYSIRKRPQSYSLFQWIRKCKKNIKEHKFIVYSIKVALHNLETVRAMYRAHLTNNHELFNSFEEQFESILSNISGKRCLLCDEGLIRGTEKGFLEPI